MLESKGASKPKTICNNPQCHRKTKGRYCNRCEQKGFGENKSYGFSSELDEWYNHKIWRGSTPNKPLGQRGGRREMQLLEQPYCEKCLEEDGVYNDVTGKRQGVVDHIERFRDPSLTEAEQWNRFIDPENHQTLCRSCHNQKSAKESNQ